MPRVYTIEGSKKQPKKRKERARMARKKSRAVLLGQASADTVAPVYGMLASGTVGFGTAATMRYIGKDKWADLAGLGAGLVVGGGMAMSKRSRAAGMVGIYTALIANGLRFAETMLFSKEKYKATVGEQVSGTDTDALLQAMQQQMPTDSNTQGVGAASAQRVPAFGAASAQEVPSLGAASAQQVPSLGVVSPEVVRSLSGASPVQFEGAGQAPGVQFQGNSLSGAYGATILGGNRD